ncbi:MAG TPA: mercuric reductase [Chthonomonadales bacterium]|nr:mercuric reductase [Chthonomonadales bacterium]
MSAHEFDLFIIGAGQAGVPLAHAAAKAGWKVALAERSHLGGSCVNFGCTPTKAAIASASLAHLARRGREYGIEIPTVTINFPAVMQRAADTARSFRTGLEEGFQAGGNPILIRAHARLSGGGEGGFRIEAGGASYTGARVVLNTGNRTAMPPIPGLEGVPALHAGNWLENRELPGHLMMMGGGVIALEMGQFYSRMGSRVTILERSGQIAGKEDPEVAAELKRLLESEGISIRLNTHAASVESTGAGVRVNTSGGQTLEGTHLFVAAGRRPNTDDLGLETVGLGAAAGKVVPVDKKLQTPVKGIWAAGDIRGGPMFTHTSWDDYRILESQFLGDGARTTDRTPVYAIFTDPQLGRAGITETEARRSGRPLKTARYDLSHNGHAIEFGRTEGFVKVTIDRSTKQILGAAVLADHGAELVHIFSDIMSAGAPYTAIKNAIHIHPTYAEAVQSAISELDAG